VIKNTDKQARQRDSQCAAFILIAAAGKYVFHNGTGDVQTVTVHMSMFAFVAKQCLVKTSDQTDDVFSRKKS
jgi:hypothetical protein